MQEGFGVKVRLLGVFSWWDYLTHFGLRGYQGPDAPLTRPGPEHLGPTQQPAPEMSWLQDSKSAILRNQTTCCTYELNPRILVQLLAATVATITFGWLSSETVTSHQAG